MDKILAYVKNEEIQRKLKKVSEDYDLIFTYFDEFNYISQINRHNPSLIVLSSTDTSFLLLSKLLSSKKAILLIKDSDFNMSGLENLFNFNYVEKNKLDNINDLIRIIIKDYKAIESLIIKVEKYKEASEEERLVKRAKLYLMKKGLTEDEAYKYILHKSMEKRVSKKVISLEVLNE